MSHQISDTVRFQHLEILLVICEDLANIKNCPDFKQAVAVFRAKLDYEAHKITQIIDSMWIGALPVVDLEGLEAEIKVVLSPRLMAFAEWLVLKYYHYRLQLVEPYMMLLSQINRPEAEAALIICHELKTFTNENIIEVGQYSQDDLRNWALNLRQAHSLQVVWQSGEFAEFFQLYSNLCFRSHKRG